MGGLFGPRYPIRPGSNPFSLTSEAAKSMTPKPTGLMGLGIQRPLTPSPFAGLLAAHEGGLAALFVDRYRRRSQWNDVFSYWERSESDSETQRIERARNMVDRTLSKNEWLLGQGVRLVPQGSFTNRTNTRLEADIDLRVQHPALKVDYLNGVDPQAAWRDGDYFELGATYGELAGRMRQEIIADLVFTFGRDKVDRSGNKAIRVNGLEGSRAEVDVVPAFTLHRITGNSLIGGVTKIEGVAILSRDGRWTENFPDQHLANGRAKRLATGHQFKKVVRIVKRLRADMTKRGVLKAKIPSFLIECLVYLVEDYEFIFATDRYDRVKNVLVRIDQILAPTLSTYSLTEINGIKPLFSGNQAWSLDDARVFTKLALAHLGDA